MSDSLIWLVFLDMGGFEQDALLRVYSTEDGALRAIEAHLEYIQEHPFPNDWISHKNPEKHMANFRKWEANLDAWAKASPLKCATKETRRERYLVVPREISSD